MEVEKKLRRALGAEGLAWRADEGGAAGTRIGESGGHIPISLPPSLFRATDKTRLHDFYDNNILTGNARPAGNIHQDLHIEDTIYQPHSHRWRIDLFS